MDRPRYQILARAAFARDQNRHVGVGNTFNHRPQRVDLRAESQQALRRQPPPQLPQQVAILRFERRPVTPEFADHLRILDRQGRVGRER